jgi:hypothetical protein
MRGVAALLAGAAAAPHFPVHSWATVPAFLHTSVLNDAVFCAADLAVAARFPAITLEKWQGCNSTAGCYRPNNLAGAGAACPSQEEATLAAAAQIKALRPAASVFTWTDSLRVYSRRSVNPSIRDVEWQSCVRNELAEYAEAHPELLLRNATGGLALEPYLDAHVYDHGNPRTAALWRDACVNATALGLDGCGADASQQPGSYVTGLTPAQQAAWTAAHVAAVANTTAAVEPLGGVVLGKLLQQLGVSVNGVLQEGCGASNATVTTLRVAAAASARDARRYLYECHSTGSEDELAAFLAGAGDDHYWGFGQWVDANCGGAAAHWSPLLEKPLGAPLADGAYDAATATWTRTFAAGVKVVFNAATNKGTVTWAP